MRGWPPVRARGRLPAGWIARAGHRHTLKLVPGTLVTGTLAVVLALASAGCTAAIPYQRAVNGPGYSDEAVPGNRFRIRYRGSPLMAPATVGTYLLYRAAEVTLASGHEYFVIERWRLHCESGLSHDHADFGCNTGFGNGDGLTRVAMQRRRQYYIGEAVISVHERPVPESINDVRDARRLIDSLGAEVSGP